MTREETKQRLPLYTAYADGKEIQLQSLGPTYRWTPATWMDLCDPKISISRLRIKPEPRVRWFVIPHEQLEHGHRQIGLTEAEACQSAIAGYGSKAVIFRGEEVLSDAPEGQAPTPA